MYTRTLSTRVYRPYSLVGSCGTRTAPSASVAIALVARHAIVQPTRAVVRSASPAISRRGSTDAMASRDYRSLPATMPGDVPLGGPRRAGPSPLFGILFDRWPPAPG